MSFSQGCHFQIKDILEENARWEEKESAHSDKRYWHHRRWLDLQIDGIYDGYMFVNKNFTERVTIHYPFLKAQHLSKWQIQYANYNCDVDEWMDIHNKTVEKPYHVDHRDHCSALIRMPGKSFLILIT